jgi:hypothetical protein
MKVITQVEKELANEGIVLFNNDNVEDDYLVLPANITDAGHKELGRYLNAFTQQKMWVRTNLGRVKSMLREATRELDEIRDKVYSKYPVKMSVTEKELKLRSDEEYGGRAKELINEIALLQEKSYILDDYLENLIDGIFNISREISRRDSDINDEAREHNVGNKKAVRRRD